jgi:hypothetical protein
MSPAYEEGWLARSQLVSLTGAKFQSFKVKVLTLKGFLGALGVSAVKKVHATAADAANCGA